MSTKLERRFTQPEVRLLRAAVAAVDSPGTVVGYASVYSYPHDAGTARALSSDLGGWKERIAPSAFDRCLRDGCDCVATINHDNNKILGRTRNRKLELSSDSHGLKFRCELPNTSYSRDLAALIDRGDLSQCSFGFLLDPDGEDWSEETDSDDRSRKVRVRWVRSAKLFDVSVVTRPSYEDTSVSKSASPQFDSLPFEAFFPEGCP
ncbi:MAG: HK97 family phage prohead protease, partial [Candidatus Acidiferrales bacterium]